MSEFNWEYFDDSEHEELCDYNGDLCVGDKMFCEDCMVLQIQWGEIKIGVSWYPCTTGGSTGRGSGLSLDKPPKTVQRIACGKEKRLIIEE